MAHAGGTRAAGEYALLDELGVVWMRRTFDWESIEAEPEGWDFTEWDAYVEAGKGAGKKILATLAYDVGWIYGEKKPRRHIKPEAIPYFLRYVETVVRRYRGKIDAFEIWNEPNNPFYFWKGPDRDFFELSRAAARRIKEIDPAVTVVAGSYWLVPERFIRGMFESGAMENVDALSFHPYGASPRAVLRMYDRLVRIISEYRFTGEIWVTEVGFPTRGVYWGGVNEDNYPEYIVKTLAGLAARGVRVNFWYELFDKYNRDEAPSRLNPSLHFGVAYPDYTRKRGAAAFALCGRYLAGTEYRPLPSGGEELPASLTRLYFRGSGGESVLLLWNDGAPAALRVSLPGTEQTRHDIISGAEEAVAGTTELLVGRTPLILTWREAPDSPPPLLRGPR
jgi:hypothetical protein